MGKIFFCLLFFIEEECKKTMTNKLSWAEFQKIKDIKRLDLEICDYRHINILNLGKEIWGKWYCRKHEKEHVLCPKLCLLVSKNILGCKLIRKNEQESEEKAQATVNQKHYKSSCYLCQKELAGAGKHGVIKNRNDPKFWGIKSEFKILCLICLERKYYRKMEEWQRKKFREYKRRGYE